MRQKLLFALVIGAGLVLAASLTGGVADASNPDNPKAVTEQNLDDEGFIRVHEQGTARVEVTNDIGVSGSITVDEPVSVEGTVDASGSSVSVDGPVDISQPVEVEGTVSVEDGNRGYAVTETANSFTAPGGSLILEDSSSAPFTTGGLVTAITFQSNRQAHMLFESDEEGIVYSVFADDDAPVHLTFPHPLDADSVTIVCGTEGDCEVGYSVSVTRP